MSRKCLQRRLAIVNIWYIYIYLSIYFKMHLMYIMEYGEENMRGYTHAIYYIDECLLRD
jgi:hypothetical protein